MNITSVTTATARSIEDLGNLLKSLTDSSTGLQEKLIKGDVTEKISDQKPGPTLDLIA